MSIFGFLGSINLLINAGDGYLQFSEDVSNLGVLSLFSVDNACLWPFSLLMIMPILGSQVLSLALQSSVSLEPQLFSFLWVTVMSCCLMLTDDTIVHSLSVYLLIMPVLNSSRVNFLLIISILGSSVFCCIQVQSTCQFQPSSLRRLEILRIHSIARIFTTPPRGEVWQSLCRHQHMNPSHNRYSTLATQVESIRPVERNTCFFGKWLLSVSSLHFKAANDINPQPSVATTALQFLHPYLALQESDEFLMISVYSSPLPSNAKLFRIILAPLVLAIIISFLSLLNLLEALILIFKHATFLRLSNLSPEIALSQADLEYQKANIDLVIQELLESSQEYAVEQFASFIMATDIRLFILASIETVTYLAL
ncbi:hypothetical protein EI94DRAFT_1707018 [Lactarius quietus]|nr:hypothetical protein EI94DRAFT_1707018 [Lactarius quietus]